MVLQRNAMKTIHSHGLVSPHVSFPNNRIARTIILLVKMALFQFPPFKIPSFMFVLRVITAKCEKLRCKV